MHRFTAINWRKAILTIGIPMLLMFGKDIDQLTPLRSMIAGLIIIFATGLGNYLADPRK